jgi:nucleoside-diphosphate-sugar epimerase
MTPEGKVAFVTGGSGFVGEALIRELRAAGWAVRALARSDAAERAVRAAGAEPVKGDLGDVAAMTTGMAGCRAVFHSAAKVETFGRRDEFLRVNVEGTQNVLDAARAAGVRRFVHVSTEAVLCGEAPIVRADETRARAKHPEGLYPETKGLAEERVLAANRDGLETVIVRPRFIWGRGDRTLLPRLVAATRAKRLQWFGGGRYPTSTCHVRNVCEGALLAEERGRPGEVYFLTDGEPVEFRSFVSRMLETQGVSPPTGTVPRGVARALATVLEHGWRLLRLPGQPVLDRTVLKLIGEEVTVVDAKARRELGYAGRVTVEQGLAELAEDARSDAERAARP